MHTTLKDHPQLNSPRKSPILLKLCALALILIGVAYTAVGYIQQYLPTEKNESYVGDIGLRMRERNYLLRGVDPYDVSGQSWEMTPTPKEQERITKHNIDNEARLMPSGYPPWGLTATFLYVAPGPYIVVFNVYDAIALLALAYTCYCAYQFGKPFGTWPGILLIGCTLGIFANATAMKLGQLGFLLNAALLCYLRMHIAKREASAGFAMAFAAIKPNYTLTQFIVMAARRQWLALGIVSTLCALASIVPWVLTGVNPIELLQQMMRQSERVTMSDTSLLHLARQIMPYSQAMPILLLTCVSVTAFTGWKYRSASPWVAASVAAVMARLCMYHRQYDNQMLLIPLIALALLAFKTGKPWAWLAFLIFGSTLWAPLVHNYYHPPLILLFSAIWLAGAAFLCWNASTLTANESNPHPSRESESHQLKKIPLTV